MSAGSIPHGYWKLSDLKEKDQPVTPEPFEPMGEARPVFFGPSSLVIGLDDDKTTYSVNLWVGGEGYNVDAHGKLLNGEWGKNFALTFEVKHGRKIDMVDAVKEMLVQYRHQIVEVYGEASADVIIHAIGKVASGHVYTRSHTTEEIMGW